MTIIAQYQNHVVEISDVYEVGGVMLASIKAIDGKPFVGGDRWPIRTEYATVSAADLTPAEPSPTECTCSPDGSGMACPSCSAHLAARYPDELPFTPEAV